MHANASPAKVDHRAVGQFLALCFGLTWSIECAALWMGVRFDEPSAGTAVLAGVMFIPALSAFVVLRLKTGSGRSSAAWRWGPWRPYAVVWLAVPALVTVIYLVSWQLGLAELQASRAAIEQKLAPSLAGTPLPELATFLGIAVVQSLTLGVAVTMLFTFGEEYGWTGFLLPSLLPLGLGRAVLIYGLVWGLWHAPVIVGGFNYPGHPMAGVAMMCLFTVAVGSVQAALLLRYRSVFLTSFLHASINAQGQGVLPMLFTAHPLLGGLVGLVGILVIGAVGVVALMATPGERACRGGVLAGDDHQATAHHRSSV